MSNHLGCPADRDPLRGTFGVVTCSSWLASQVGMRVLELGGNAFDAAAAVGLTLPVVEPQECGLGGEAVILFLAAGEEQPMVVCGQGPAPAGATIDHYRALGLDLIPGHGPLAAVVPGLFDAWMLLLRDRGTMALNQLLGPAIGYASRGFPIYPQLLKTIRARERALREWPTTRAIYLPNDQIPVLGSLFCNPALAQTYSRLVGAADAAGNDHEAQIEEARRSFYQGFVAEAIDAFVSGLEFRAANGTLQKGVLAAHDLALWRATYEPPVSYRFHDTIVFKAGPWSQGPVLLQMLALLRHSSILDMNPLGADFIHTFVETSKLAFADREAWYGDANYTDVPMSRLLSAAYNERRWQQVGWQASGEFKPGTLEGRVAVMPRYELARADDAEGHSGDTCHIDVIDRWGNIVSATCSGGWFTGGPAIEDLGFALSTRAQQFWLQKGLSSSLEPGKRPRTTLSPTLAMLPSGRWLAFGARGVDRADQWALQFFLAHISGRRSLQGAVDSYMFHSEHWPSSSFPRQARPRELVLQEGYSTETIDRLAARGHAIRRPLKPDFACLSAAARQQGAFEAAASTYVGAAAAVGR